MIESNPISRFLDNPQKLLEHIRETGDFDAGFDYVRVVYDVVSKFDGTLDVVLRGMEDLWVPSEHSGQTFYEAARQMTPLSPTTIRRHTRVGRMLEQVPEQFKPRVESMDFQSKIYISGVTEDVARGRLDVTDEQWGRIVEQPSRQGVAMEIQRVRGKDPRSQFCHFMFDDDGVIWAFTSKGEVRAYVPVEYEENAEMEEFMEWVHEKAVNKLEATPK